jgi:hypothetical protein
MLFELIVITDMEFQKAADRQGQDLAVTVSSRPRQEADFRRNGQGWPRSGVGEVREQALPATSGPR